MSEELQFEHADRPTASAEPTCKCGTPLQGHYYQADGTLFCDRCIETLQKALKGKGSSAGRFLTALLLGTGAALLCGIGYGVFIKLTNIEFALITIAIGWFVGMAVRRGSGGRGGWRYGALAVVLTYSALALSYFGVAVAAQFDQKSATPALIHADAAPLEEAVSDGSESSNTETPPEAPNAPMNPLLAILTLAGLAFAMPVLYAQGSILSALITGFGLWQAWSMNRAAHVEITGPHAIGGAPPASRA